MASRNIKKVIIPNPDLEQALKGFVPVFGNSKDFSIVQRLGKLQKKLDGIDNEVLRSFANSKDNKRPPGRMREILEMEGVLIREITERNLDF